MEFQPDTQVCTFYPETRVPDAKGARRAASLCSFAAVAEITIAYALLIPTTLLTRDISMSDQMRSNLSLIINTAVIDLIAMPLCWLLLLLIPKDASPEIGTRTPLSFKKLLFYFPCAFALMLAGSLTGRLIDALLGGDLSNVVSDTMSAVDPWVTLLCAVIVGPIAEELFFRKAMIDIRARRWSAAELSRAEALSSGRNARRKAESLYWRGVAAGMLGHEAESVGFLKEALGLGLSLDQSREARLMTADADLAAGRLDAAREAYVKLVKEGACDRMSASKTRTVGRFLLSEAGKLGDGDAAEAARDAAHALRHRHTAAADRAAHEIETLLADTDLFEHYRMALLET